MVDNDCDDGDAVSRPRRMFVALSEEEYASLLAFAVRKGHSRVQDWARVVLLHELKIGEWAEESALDTPPELGPDDETDHVSAEGRAPKTWPPKEGE